jgi:hypothetical protein
MSLKCLADTQIVLIQHLKGNCDYIHIFISLSSYVHYIIFVPVVYGIIPEIK